MRRRCRLLLAVLAGSMAASLVGGAAASAQDAPSSPEPVRNVQVGFELGAFDPELGDWTIDAVEVSGDLADGAAFTVELQGVSDRPLWTSTQPYDGRPTRIALTGDVTVGEVTSAAVSQPDTVVAGVQIERPEVTWSAAGGGGSGRLALSMVLAVLVVVVLFRSPLPSASTQRWTR